MKQFRAGQVVFASILATGGLLAIAGFWGPKKVTGGEVTNAPGDRLDCCSLTFASMKTPATMQDESAWMKPVVSGEICFTQQRYIAHMKPDEGSAPAALCPDLGPADVPATRNAAIPTGSTPIKTYRLSIHVFRYDDGTSATATQAQVDAAVAALNVNYAPWLIQFVYETDYTNSTVYRNLSGSSEEWFMKKNYAKSPTTKLNIYVVNTGGGNWGTFPWDPDSLGKQGGVVVHENYFVGAPEVLTHEVGHCLGLWHTFHGTAEVACGSECYEPVGRTPEVGDVTGDHCSDTLPTSNQNSVCEPVGTDCYGSPYAGTAHPYQNFRSYSLSCANQFTAQQAGRMHAWTNSNLTGWLYVAAPPVAPSAPSLTKLSGGAIQVVWGDNSNDEQFFDVQRAKKSGSTWIEEQVVATLPANSTSTTNSPGTGATFRYRVIARNAVGSSASGWTQIKN